ncbi:MAG: hypothetical protein HY317_05680 [Acidobacteria bacterium]|nr:hypothetical protein [Acidobacteriota bacterium]
MKPGRPSRTDGLYPACVALAGVSLAALYYADAPLRAGLGTDAMHHMAAVRELAKGEFPPKHNLVVHEGLPQGHYGPYLVLLGAMARLTGTDPLHLLYAAGLANLLAFALALRATTARLAGEGAAQWSLLAAVLLWGPWPGATISWPSWRWPGTTSLADAQNFFYPHQAGLVLFLLVLRLVLPPPGGERGLPRPHALAAAVALTAALVATHPLTALALAAALVTLGGVGLARRTASAPRTAFLVGLPVAGLALAALWPYYPVLGLLEAAAHPGLRQTAPGGLVSVPPAGGAALVSSAALALDPAAFVVPLVAVLGPAVFGLVGAVLVSGSGRAFLVAWFAVDVALALCPVLPLRERFVFFAALPLQIGAAVLLDLAWARGRWGRALAVGLLAAGALSMGARVRWLLGQERPDLAFVARLTPEDAVVLADRDTANGVAGLAGRKVVAPQHPDLFLVAAGGWQRVLDVDRFLDPRADLATRGAILQRWRVTHVLVDRARTPRLELPYPVAHDRGDYVLYDVRPQPRAAGP